MRAEVRAGAIPPAVFNPSAPIPIGNKFELPAAAGGPSRKKAGPSQSQKT